MNLEYFQNKKQQKDSPGLSAILGNSTVLQCLIPVVQRTIWSYTGGGVWQSKAGGGVTATTEYLEIPERFWDLLEGNSVYFDDRDGMFWGSIRTPGGIERFNVNLDDLKNERILNAYTLATKRFAYHRRKWATQGTVKVDSDGNPLTLQNWKRGYNPHHIIPDEIVRKTIMPINYAPYDEAWNCIMLPSSSDSYRTYKSDTKGSLLPLHANHPRYNLRANNELRSLRIQDAGTDDQKLIVAKIAAGYLRAAIKAMRPNASGKQKKLNDISTSIKVRVKSPTIAP